MIDVAGRVFAAGGVSIRPSRQPNGAGRHPDACFVPDPRDDRVSQAGDPSLEAETAVLLRAVQAQPRDARPRVRLAAALMRAGAHDRAIIVLAEGLATMPRSAELLTQHCVALRLGGRHARAAEALVALAAAVPDHPRLHQMRGDLAAARGDLAAAIEHYAADVAAAPREADRRARLAQTLCRAGTPERAVAVLAEGLAEVGDAPELLAQYSAALRLAGRFDAAADANAALARARPDHPLLHQLRGELALAQGDLANAILHLRADVAAAPGEAHRRARLAQALYRAGDHAQSAAVLAEGLEAAPGSPELLAQTCVALRLAGRYDEAQAAIAALARAHAHHPQLHLLRGELALARDDHATANAHYRADLAANPRDATRRVRLSQGLRRVGDLHAALALMAAVREPAPAERAVQAEILMELGRFDEADALLAAWPEQEDPATRSRVAAQSAALRYDHVAALAHAEATLALAPQDTRAALFRAQAAALLFQTDRAWQAMRQVAIAAPGGGPPRRGRGRLRNLIGQIINEQRLDPEETALLAATAGAGGMSLATTAAAVLRDGSTGIGPALGLLTGLAQAGRLVGRTAPGDPAATIPRILHQYWDSAEPPEEITRLMDHARATNAGMAYTRWHDETARTFLKVRARPDVARAYGTARHAAMRSDILRLALLAIEGGVYLDADDLCVAPLETLLPKGARLVVYQENLGSIGNNFLAAAPGHPLIAEALALATAAVLNGASEVVWLVTGPGLISRVVASAIATMPSLQLPQGLLVASLPQFLRVVRPHQRLAYKTGGRHWTRAG